MQATEKPESYLMRHAALTVLLCLVISTHSHAQCGCGPLPPPQHGEAVVYASSTSEVQSAIAAANGRTTIYMNTGTYHVNSSSLINVYKPSITIRSVTGNRDDVIIWGEGMAAGGLGHGIYVDADDVTIADLTVRDVQNHGFFVNPGSDNCLFHNVRGLDCGEQIFKASGDISSAPKNDGVIRCSTFEYSVTLDDGDDGWYTNGIDLLNCHNWVIRDNVIRNIKHNPSLTSTLAGPAILIWRGSSNTIVERNRILECDFGISFGNAGEGGVSHTGGIIRNNFVLGYADSDFAIGLIYAPGAKVLNNTVYAPGGWPYSIEARFSESRDILLMNNFTDEPILPDRDGASAAMTTNSAMAAAADFVDIGSGDLHLASAAVPAVDAGTQTPDRITDIDCEGVVLQPDLGADEFVRATGVEAMRSLHEGFDLYPVPSTGMLTVSGPGIRLAIILNVNGQMAGRYRAVRGGISIDMRNRAKGIYFIKIVTGSGVVDRMFVLK